MSKMTSIHLKCARDGGGGLTNLTFDKASGTYRSGSWKIGADAAARLVGGWLYLHEAKAVPSQFGGRILAFEPIEQQEPAGKEHVVLVVRPVRECRGQKWRGAEAGGIGGVIESLLPHEQL
jgi:hypothetical protein